MPDTAIATAIAATTTFAHQTPATSPLSDGPRLPPDHPGVDIDRLGDQIAEISAHIQAATYRLLVLIHEFDARGGWNGGFRSCAHWLNWRTGLDLGAAREKVRVARTLEILPTISAAMRAGEISYSKVRALTRVATPENEVELLHFALTGTAAHVESLVRAWRRVDRIESLEDDGQLHNHRYLTAYPDEDGMLVVKARLTPEAGAIFRQALEAATEVRSEVPAEQRRADALELLAESALEGGLDPGTAGDRYQVVVHVEEKELKCSCLPRPNGAQDADFSEPVHVSGETSHEGWISRDPGLEEGFSPGADLEDRIAAGGELEDGLCVSAETCRRLACDCSRVVMTDDSRGGVLDVGRKTRSIHPAMRRALKHRDGGCRFPGCGLHICDAHHVEHWADGGKTELGNLLLLCRHHHRALHEGGFRVELDADGTSRFYTSKGALIPEAPPSPPLKADSVAVLERRHRDEGIEIGATTGFPRWQGEPFDLGYAILALREAVGDSPDPSQAH